MFNTLYGEIVKHGLNKEQFADILGMPRNTFSTKINGKRDFTLTEIKRILEFFKSRGSDCTFEYLFLSKMSTETDN